MKRVFFLWVLFICNYQPVFTQTYQPVDQRSSVRFVIKNVGMDTEGKFSGLEGSIIFNPADLKNASFSISIDANSVNTDIEPRDNNLREAEYLDTKKFPRISFISKQVTHTARPDIFLVKGTITIKGISKELVFQFKTTPADDGLLFTGEMKLNKNDFKIGIGSLVLSDNLTVILSVFARKG